MEKHLLSATWSTTGLLSRPRRLDQSTEDVADEPDEVEVAELDVDIDEVGVSPVVDPSTTGSLGKVARAE
jgi:hypothetical protein